MYIVSHSQIKPFVSKAAKDHVSAKDSKNTIWFTYDCNTTQPCFCGLMQVSGGFRIKAVWVHPSRRGAGIGAKMTKELLDYAINVLNAQIIQVFAYNAKFYESMGFEKYGALPNGAQMLKKIYK